MLFLNISNAFVGVLRPSLDFSVWFPLFCRVNGSNICLADKRALAPESWIDWLTGCQRIVLYIVGKKK